MRILVTNDDGVGAEGIDVLVEALIADPNNEVTVCGPATNQKRHRRYDGLRNGERHGRTDPERLPGDGRRWLPRRRGQLRPRPGQWLLRRGQPSARGDLRYQPGAERERAHATNISGTVGAAKTAARDHDVPALATSQGSSVGAPVAPPASDYDYDSGVSAALAWLAEHRSALAAGTVTTDTVDSLNTPTCTAGEVRGLREVRLAADATDAFEPQNCESTLENPQTDVEAFINGFNALSPVPAN